MKKLLLMLVAFMAVAVSVTAAPGSYPGGITTGSRSQQANAKVATGAGDLFVYDDLEVYGGIMGKKEGPWTCVAVSSINFAYLIAIATSTLDGGTTVWTLAESAMYNNALSSGAPRTLLISCRATAATTDVYDAYGGTKSIQGSATIYGIDNHFKTVSETILFSTNSWLGGELTGKISTTTYHGAGRVAWVRVDSMTFTLVGVSSYCVLQPCVSIMVGLGAGIGLLNNITSLSDINAGVTLNGLRVDGAGYGVDVAKDVVYLTTTTLDNGLFMCSFTWRPRSSK